MLTKGPITNLQQFQKCGSRASSIFLEGQSCMEGKNTYKAQPIQCVNLYNVPLSSWRIAYSLSGQ